MSKRLRQSRFRRMPGVYRFGDRKPADPGLERRQITIDLPDRLLEQAEAQSHRAGAESVQAYCADLLAQTIEVEHAREVVKEAEARRGALEGLDEIANDPEYLADWAASAVPESRRPGPNAEEPTDATEPRSDPGHVLPSDSEPRDDVNEPIPAVEVVLRHAGIQDDDPSAFLPTLRRGEPLNGETAQELLRALAELEAAYGPASRLDRMVAYALHRLAFEGQILLTDAWSGVEADGATVDVLRIVQEAVDRVLSGQDIRYFGAGDGPETLP